MPLVLIIDDNDRNRKLARDVLRAAGLQTLEAATGADGVRLATEHEPDVILMDLVLPDMNGVDAAKTLRGSVRTANIPIVAVSAISLQGSDDWLTAIGFAGWIEKPIQIGGFASQVLGFCRSEG
jgi:two-component system, cell cycle response regulator DivK